MYRMRAWSVHNARGLKALYTALEDILFKLHPLWRWLGYERVDKPFSAIEKLSKGFLLDSKSCGQCIVGSTGMSCPMNCPKSLRNGPCGGVRANGKCEVDPEMTCVWVLAWEGNKRMATQDYPIQIVQPAVDNRRHGTSAWMREVRRRVQNKAADTIHEI